MNDSYSNFGNYDENKFLKFIWRNHYIKIQIINQLRIFKKYELFQVESINELKELIKSPFINYVSHLKYSNLYEPLEAGLLDNCYTVNELTIIHYPGELNDSNIIPNSINILRLPLYDQIRITIPSCIKKLYLGSSLRESESLIPIPKTIESLSLYLYNYDIKEGDIPTNITDLDLGHYFNQKILPNVLPNSLNKLRFSYQFNQPLKIGVIPPSITHLSFGHWFNQKLEKNIIPNNVKYLEFGEEFSQAIRPNILPLSITHLVFKNSKMKKILSSQSIPKSVKILKFGCN